MADFNILHDGWIQVEKLNGKKSNVGIVECLKEAHNIKRILPSCDIKMTTVSNLRLLQEFIYDMYRPQSDDLNGNGIERILNKKSFDATMIDQYINDIINEGCEFNVFHEENPCLQCRLSDFELVGKDTLDKFVKKSGFIDVTTPAANNDLFFGVNDTNKYEEYYGVNILDKDFQYKAKNAFINCFELTYEEYVTHLILDMLYLGAKGEGWDCSFYGNETAFMVINGKNLFETILLNMTSLSVDYSYKPFYRCDYKDFRKDIHVPENNGFPVMKHHLSPYNLVRYKDLDEEKRIVKTIYFQKTKMYDQYTKDMALKIKSYYKENDPMTIKFATGSKNKTMVLSSKQIYQNSWLRLYDFINVAPACCKSNSFIENIGLIEGNLSFSITCWYITNVSKINEEIFYEFEYDKSIVDINKVVKIKQVLDGVSSLGDDLSRKVALIRHARDNHDKEKARKQLGIDVEYDFFYNNFIRKCHSRMFFGEDSWINTINNGGDISVIFEEMCKIGTDIFKLLNVKYTIENANNIKKFYFAISKFKKEKGI